MIRVSIIGSGNVAFHLATAFEAAEQTELLQIVARNPQNNFPKLSNRTIHSVQDLALADVYLIAVSDDAIAEVAASLPFSGRLVAHTSGTVAVSAIDAKNRRGVFYPLQTFSKSKPVSFSEIPICLEADMPQDYELLLQVATAISEQSYKINSEQRKSLHVAAVFASNFTNHLYSIASEICDEHQLSFDILKPLIAETANKIQTLNPTQAQTGPAIRNDNKTIEAHLKLLTDENHKTIYRILTQSIQHGKKL